MGQDCVSPHGSVSRPRDNSVQADDNALPTKATETRVLTTETLWIFFVLSGGVMHLGPWLRSRMQVGKKEGCCLADDQSKLQVGWLRIS